MGWRAARKGSREETVTTNVAVSRGGKGPTAFLVWMVFLSGVAGLAQFPATPAAAQATDDIGATGGRVRTYYVAAEEVDWDYAPLGIDMIAIRAIQKPESRPRTSVRPGRGDNSAYFLPVGQGAPSLFAVTAPMPL